MEFDELFWVQNYRCKSEFVAEREHFVRSFCSLKCCSNFTSRFVDAFGGRVPLILVSLNLLGALVLPSMDDVLRSLSRFGSKFTVYSTITRTIV